MSAELREALGAALTALSGLAARLRGGGPFVGVLLVGCGAVLLAAADRLRRPVALLGGAAVGALAAHAARGILPGALSPAGWAWVAAILCGGGAALAPPAFPALAGALAGGLLGAHVPVAGKPALGAFIAAAVGAAFLSVGARSVAAVLASVAGGLAVGVGLVVLAGGREIGVELATSPFVLLGIAVVLGIAGAAFQLAGEKGRPRLPEAPRLPRE
ncbi:MAG TPA: hypothetical protein VEB43_21545 [Anaeromyxobacter sp.]|nr:hypothetical protein [Anaeromyxobacter sp.]